MSSTVSPPSDQPLAWALPPGMRATRATRALERLYHERPHAALSEAEVEAALAAAGDFLCPLRGKLPGYSRGRISADVRKFIFAIEIG